MEKWHDDLSEGNPTVVDALLDRLVSGAIRPRVPQILRVDWATRDVACVREVQAAIERLV